MTRIDLTDRYGPTAFALELSVGDDNIATLRLERPQGKPCMITWDVTPNGNPTSSGFYRGGTMKGVVQNWLHAAKVPVGAIEEHLRAIDAAIDATFAVTPPETSE
jgi:hypothetical protein